MDYTRLFDVIVVGGGHAGTEAAHAAARPARALRHGAAAARARGALPGSGSRAPRRAAPRARARRACAARRANPASGRWRLFAGEPIRRLIA